MINLPEKLKYVHTEVNDDGREIVHRGYEIRKCENCNREFLCGNTSISNLCGYPDCGKEAI